MRVILYIVVLLLIVGVLVADGASMYGAHRNAVNFSNAAAQQAAQTYVDTGGSQAAVEKTIHDMAINQGVEVLGLSYHQGTTQWYEVTVRAEGPSILLKHLPYFKDHVAQESTSIAHF